MLTPLERELLAALRLAHVQMIKSAHQHHESFPDCTRDSARALARADAVEAEHVKDLDEQDRRMEATIERMNAESIADDEEDYQC